MSPSSWSVTRAAPVRLFLALNIPVSARERIRDATAPLRAAAPRVSWTPQDRLHVTLKFLGEQTTDVAQALREALTEPVGRHRETSVAIGGLGAFPNLLRPRVVWMGVRDPHRLELLQHDVEMVCGQLGFPVEGRAFRPHLTLARVRDAVPDPEISALRTAARLVRFEETIAVTSVDVMRSAPGPSGPHYTVLGAVPLRAA